jgi:hypothetical protein
VPNRPDNDQTGSVPTEQTSEYWGVKALVAGVLYAGLASLASPLTSAALAAWALPAAGILVGAGGGRRSRRVQTEAYEGSPGLRRTTMAWAVIAMFAIFAELTAWLRQPGYNVASVDHPTISVLLDPVTDFWPLRFALWCGWLWVGWRVARP